VDTKDHIPFYLPMQLNRFLALHITILTAEVYSSETPASAYKTILRHNPEHCNLITALKTSKLVNVRKILCFVAITFDLE
jgi:hypothetical protein